MKGRKEMTKVFVYGSLKRDFGNHRFLISSMFLGEATSKNAEYTMLSMKWFPGVCKVGNSFIAGEVYEVSETTLRRLDHLEGNGTFYTRELISLSNGMDAWIWLLPKSYINEETEFDGVVLDTIGTAEWLGGNKSKECYE